MSYGKELPMAENEPDPPGVVVSLLALGLLNTALALFWVVLGLWAVYRIFGP